MMMPGKEKRERREKRAAAFLQGVETPGASSRLKDHGLQRILARAETGDDFGVAIPRRWGAYHAHALAYRFILVLLFIPLVLALFTTGAYALSYDAQPDSALYSTKIFFERARIALTTSTSSDIRLEIEYSNLRLNELEKMVTSGKRKGADRWLREYARNVEAANSLIEKVSQQDAEAISLQLLETLDRQAVMMEAMSQGQYPDLTGQIEQAYSLCNQERERMRQRCGGGSEGFMQPPSDSEGSPGGCNGQGSGQNSNQESQGKGNDPQNNP
jgi:Domain of unknown function (DUF5667)